MLSVRVLAILLPIVCKCVLPADVQSCAVIKKTGFWRLAEFLNGFQQVFSSFQQVFSSFQWERSKE